MTISQGIPQALPTLQETVVVNMDSPMSGTRHTGLFGSILAGLFEPGVPSQSEPFGEDWNNAMGDEVGKEEEGSNGELSAMFRPNVADSLVQAAQITRDGGEARAVREPPLHGNAGAVTGKTVSETALELMKQETVNGLQGVIASAAGQAKDSVDNCPQGSLNPTEEEQSLTGTVHEESSGWVSESGDAAADRLDTANLEWTSTGGKAVTGNAISRFHEGKVESPNIGDSNQVVAGRNPDSTAPLRERETSGRSGQPPAGRTTAESTPSEMIMDEAMGAGGSEGRKVAANPSAEEVFELTDKKKEMTEAGVVRTRFDSASARREDPVEVKSPERSGSTWKGEDSGKIEVVFSDSSAMGESHESTGHERAGKFALNAAENGKTNQNFPDLNAGTRSFENLDRNLAPSQNTVSETAKPLSHDQIIQQIREKLAAHQSNGDSGRITLRLHPEELGELKVSMKMENQTLRVEIVAENQAVKEALMSNMDSLKEALSRQNIAMERFNVLTGGGHGSGGTYREWKHAAQNFLPNHSGGFAGLNEDVTEGGISYPDSTGNSLVDLRL